MTPDGLQPVLPGTYRVPDATPPELRAIGVRNSFVPRDPATYRALCEQGAFAMFEHGAYA